MAVYHSADENAIDQSIDEMREWAPIFDYPSLPTVDYLKVPALGPGVYKFRFGNEQVGNVEYTPSKFSITISINASDHISTDIGISMAIYSVMSPVFYGGSYYLLFDRLNMNFF